MNQPAVYLPPVKASMNRVQSSDMAAAIARKASRMINESRDPEPQAPPPAPVSEQLTVGQQVRMRGRPLTRGTVVAVRGGKHTVRWHHAGSGYESDHSLHELVPIEGVVKSGVLPSKVDRDQDARNRRHNIRRAFGMESQEQQATTTLADLMAAKKPQPQPQQRPVAMPAMASGASLAARALAGIGKPKR